jgi:hypothetical protein
MYLPVLRGQALVTRGRALEGLAPPDRGSHDEPEGGPAAEAYRLAAAADPYCPDPWMQLASFWHRRWLGSREDQDFARFQEAVEKAQRLQPRSYSARRQIGTWYLSAFRAGGEPLHRSAALRAFRHAARLYPHSAIAQAEQAWAEHVAGELVQCRATARVALELDRQNPHPDHKLRDHLLPDAGPAEGQAPHQPAAPTGRAAECLRGLLAGEGGPS